MKYKINGDEKLIPIHPCQFEELSRAINQSYFYYLQLNNAYCLDLKTFDLEGYFDEYTNKLMQIYILYCNNASSNGTCKPVEEINKIAKNSVFTFIHDEVELDSTDYASPLKINLTPHIVTLNPLMTKSFLYFIKNTEVKTDDGWLFAGTNIQTDTGIKQDEYFQELDFRTNDYEPIAFMNVVASKKYDTCTRNYQKLPESIASVLGMANLFMVIGMVVCNFISYVASMKYVVNKLYSFDKVGRMPKKNDIHKIPSKEHILKKKKKPIFLLLNYQKFLRHIRI